MVRPAGLEPLYEYTLRLEETRSSVMDLAVPLNVTLLGEFSHAMQTSLGSSSRDS